MKHDEHPHLPPFPVSRWALNARMTKLTLCSCASAASACPLHCTSRRTEVRAVLTTIITDETKRRILNALIMTAYDSQTP